MDETPCTNKDIDSPVSAVLDHRKRKKDEDMTEDQDIPRAKLHLTWTQGEQDVLMTTKLGAGDGEADKVEVTFAEQQMTIKLSDGREHCWCFHGAIDKDQSRVQRKKGKFTIKVVKKEAGLWPSLEAVEKPAVQEGNVEHMSSDNEMMDSSQEVRRKEEEPIMDLHHIKHDFFERDDSLTVHIYVKNVSKDAVKVHFDKQSFMVKFQTSDVKFLQLHEGASEDTVFCWKVSTKKAICPAACKHKFTPSFIELTLKKVSAERWGMLEALQRKEMASSSKSASWIAAKSGSSGAVTTGGDSGSVAFDEMTPVDINRRDSDSADISTAAQTGSNSFRNQKPTAKVQPLNKQAMEMSVITPGYTGLDNLGNTCFMNSVIQVLANTCEFRDYFLNGLFQRELNRDNVLGTGGQLAVAFAVLLRVLWGGTCHTCAPSKLKELVSRKANQFMGFQQHDAQEFLAFLLDGLHEDVNRVKAKPYTEAVEDDGRPDHVVADEAWEMYKRRNDSFVVDLLQGQYKSKLVCPICKKVSITFDPFLYLSVPLPKRKKTITVNFMWRDPIRKPVKFLVQLVKDSSVQHLKEILSRKTHVLPNNMRVFEVHRSLFHKHFVNGNDLSGVQPNDLIIVSEVLSAETAGEEVVEVEVIQRTLTAHQYPTRCSSCHKECKSGEKLRRCTKCLKTGYCDQTCQRSHWQIHRNQCNTAPEPVGCPFILSLPRSHCTYSCIARLMESFARYSVDTFQPPVKAEPITPTIITTTTTTSPVTNLMLPPSGDLQLPSHTSASNLSSSSGSQSSGSLSSLDSISSCSSTATLTAETSQATFDISHSGEEEDDKEQEEKGKELSLDDGGYGDITSDLGSSVSSQGSAACPMSSFGATDGESGREKFSKDCLASPSTSQGAEKMGTGVTVQSVAANRHTERSVPLFFIKPVTAEGRGIRELDRLDDKGTSPLDMSAYRCLSMDWRNSEKLASYVLVQSKPLETDLDESVLCGSQYESDTITLHQCLELFTEPEILAPNEAWYCPRCKAEREASKQMSIWRLPHTLIIQLKRFSFRNALWRDKIDKMVEFPIRGLDMSPFAAGAHRPGDPQPIYDLYGVVNHHGGILGGHYTSFARCAHPTIPLKNEVGWRLFDDSRVTSISNEKNVVTRAAYLLFYRRRQPFVPSVSPAQLPLTAPAAAEQERAKESNEDGMASNNEDLGGSAEMVGSLADNFEEKHDMEKDEDDNEECSGDSGLLVIDMDDPMPALGYTDMDAVD